MKGFKPLAISLFQNFSYDRLLHIHTWNNTKLIYPRTEQARNTIELRRL